MEISKDKLLEQYKNSVNEIFDTCEWKTNFTSKDVCGVTYGILTKNGIDFPMPIEDFHSLYIEKCSSLVSSNQEWRMNYSVDEIIDIVYDLLIL